MIKSINTNSGDFDLSDSDQSGRPKDHGMTPYWGKLSQTEYSENSIHCSGYFDNNPKTSLRNWKNS